MKCRALGWLVKMGLVLVVFGIGAVAQNSSQMRFSGVINDFTPASLSGPWEVRGEWSLQLNGNSGKAQFSAMLTMERSDEGVILNGSGDFDSGAGRHAHVHHIVVQDGVVTPLTNGFRIIGVASIAANGGTPPFGLQSPVQIDVTGSSVVQYSNMNLTFGAPASTHFGTLAFNGVVQNAKDDDE